ncbi:exodeoxyribonuclease VII large subunit [candidate division WOR-3 bacterium]|nr:exodeoxyribonuclease VII large subunit [candidate division WOR-3 bacterium]
MKVYTVSEITGEIKDLLEDNFPLIWVEGEVTDYRPSSSGHLYFGLKDEYAVIQCIVWREYRTLTTVEIENGKKIRVYGGLQVYAKGGRYSLRVERVYPIGIGELQIKFEELKRKLKEDGLFEEWHKKPIPEFPERIGIVTALDGAAVKDIINVAKRRYKGIEIIIRSSRVQGEGAASEIAEAIREFNEYNVGARYIVPLLIVGRGGGSIEDLWAFNEEVVARAIYDSQIPVISAVGHEIDTTIADFVADKRAPTPSVAAELAVKDSEEILEDLSTIAKRMGQGLERRVRGFKDKLSLFERSYGIKRLRDLIYQRWQIIDELTNRLGTSFTHPLIQKSSNFKFLVQRLNREAYQFLKNREQEVLRIEGELSGVNPKATLKRGYSICYKLPDKKVVKTSKILAPKDDLEIEFSEGKAKCEVINTEDH